MAEEIGSRLLPSIVVASSVRNRQVAAAAGISRFSVTELLVTETKLAALPSTPAVAELLLSTRVLIVARTPVGGLALTRAEVARDPTAGALVAIETTPAGALVVRRRPTNTIVAAAAGLTGAPPARRPSGFVTLTRPVVDAGVLGALSVIAEFMRLNPADP